jgi:hypothetical protein
MSEYKKHREFIHAVSNHLAISDGALKKIKSLKKKEQSEKTIQEVNELLDLSEKYTSECIVELREYRTFLHMLESK